MRRKTVDKALLPEIIEDYKSGMSLKKLSGKYGSSQKTLGDMLRKEGIEIRPSGSEIYLTKSPFHFNKHWLDELDCPEKFYFLGFFAADGYNRKDQNIVVIKLQEQDSELLEKFNNLLESDRPLYYGLQKASLNRKEENYCELKFTSKYFCNKLDELGLPQAKTYILKFPDYIPEEYMRDYIRGVFDGDGNISVSYADIKSPKGTTSIVGNVDFVYQIKECLENILGVYVNVFVPKDGNWAQIKVNRQEDIKTFLDWLYKDATIYLERKYQKYQEFLSVRDFEKETIGQKRRKIATQENDIIEDYYNLEYTIKDIMNKYNCSDVTIYRILKKHNLKSNRYKKDQIKTQIIKEE